MKIKLEHFFLWLHQYLIDDKVVFLYFVLSSLFLSFFFIIRLFDTCSDHLATVSNFVFIANTHTHTKTICSTQQNSLKRLKFREIGFSECLKKKSVFNRYRIMWFRQINSKQIYSNELNLTPMNRNGDLLWCLPLMCIPFEWAEHWKRCALIYVEKEKKPN